MENELKNPSRNVRSEKFVWLEFIAEWKTASRVLKSKKKRLALTFLYCLGQETWLNDSWKLIYINQSSFYNFFHVGKFKNV